MENVNHESDGMPCIPPPTSITEVLYTIMKRQSIILYNIQRSTDNIVYIHLFVDRFILYSIPTRYISIDVMKRKLNFF